MGGFFLSRPQPHLLNVNYKWLMNGPAVGVFESAGKHWDVFFLLQGQKLCSVWLFQPKVIHLN